MCLLEEINSLFVGTSIGPGLIRISNDLLVRREAAHHVLWKSPIGPVPLRNAASLVGLSDSLLFIRW